MLNDPRITATVAATIGLAVAVFAVVAEMQVRGMGLMALQRSSILVWVVESLPLALAAVGWGLAERRMPGRAVVDLPRAAPVEGPGAPPVVPTPPAAPPMWVGGMSSTPLPVRRVLLVDGSVDGPAVAGRLKQAGMDVVHVRDSASGSLAREAEGPDSAIVRGGEIGAAALLGELGRYGIPVAVIAPPAGLRLPRRSMAVSMDDDLGDALDQLDR